MYNTVESLYQDTSISRTFLSVLNATFVYLTTSEMRTPQYSGHFNLPQWCPDYSNRINKHFRKNIFFDSQEMKVDEYLLGQIEESSRSSINDRDNGDQKKEEGEERVRGCV